MSVNHWQKGYRASSQRASAEPRASVTQTMLMPVGGKVRAAFDDLTYAAASMCDAATALILRTASDTLVVETPLGVELERALCSDALFALIDEGGAFSLPDLTLDSRFATDPLSRDPFGFRMLVGKPLRTSDGQLWGALCVLDTRVRELDETRSRGLDALARQLERQLPARRTQRTSDVRTRDLGLLAEMPPNDRRMHTAEALHRMWMLDESSLEQMLTGALRITIAHLGLPRATLDFRTASGRSVSIAVTDAGAGQAPRLRVLASEPLPMRSQGSLCLLADALDQDPRRQGLDPYDRLFVGLVARFLAAAIARQDREHGRAEVLDRLQKIAAHVPGMIYQYHMLTDGSSHYPYVSEGIRDIFRVGPEAVRSDASPVFDVLHPEDRDSVIASIRLSAERLTPWYDRYRIRFDDGTVRWLDAHATPTRLEDGSTLWHGFISDVTERIHQARALEAEREMNRRLLEALPVGVIACDDDGQLSLFNHVARRWHSVEQLANDQVPWEGQYALFATDGVTPLSTEDTPLARALRGERVRDAEMSIIAKGQPARHVTTNGALLRSKDGTPMGAVAVMLDITARKRAEADLQTATATLRHVLDAAVKAAIIATDLAGRVTIFNAGAERMLGYATGQVIGQHQSAFPLPDGAQDGELTAEFGTPLATFGVFVTMAQRGGSEAHDWTFVTQAGELVPVSVFASTIRDEQGNALGYLGIAVDNTERLRSEAALREHARSTQAILDNVVDAIVTIDARGRIESFNPAAERVFGASAFAMLGRSVRLLLPVNARVGALAKLMSAPGQAIETEGVRADGSRFEMEIAISHLERDGHPLFIGIVRDVSERRRMERMKSEFTSTVSHELRTPLTSIAGSLGLLDGGALGELPEHALRMIRIAYKNCQRLTDLINDLLDMDKMLAGKMRMNLHNLPVMPIVTQALAANEGYGVRHDVQFKLVETADDVEIRVDANRLLQILANFLSNAAKFSPPGASVEVLVRVMAETVRIAVRDHGPGVPSSFHDKIFERFSQADSSDARQRGGTGLGLAITRSLAERMNAQVGFESIEGQGATFYIDMPRVLSLVDDPSQEPSRLMSLLPNMSPLPRLLHIESSADFRAVLRAQCNGIAKLEGAGSVREARSKLALMDPAPDLILIDLELPDGSGVLLAGEIRARWPLVPIVVLSAAEFDRADVDWASAVLVKSRTTPQRLHAAIRACSEPEIVAIY